jgi:hypothetical protein
MADPIDDNQKEIIRLIDQESKRQGLDPDYGLAVAGAESNYKHIPASDPKSTAYGPFQVNKDTAKTLGIDYDAMVKDPKLAIQAGVANLVRHAKNPDIAGDPIRVAAAHHYGADSPYAKTGDTAHLSPEAANYLADIGSRHPGGDFPQSIYTPPNADSKPGVRLGGDNAEQLANDQGEHPGSMVSSGASTTPDNEDAKRQFMQATSALGGAGTSALLQGTGKGISLLPYAASQYFPNKFPLTEDTTMTRSGLERWMKSGTHATNLANLNLSDLEKEYNNLMSKTDPNWKPMKLRNMKEVGAAINAMTPTKDQQVTQPIYKLVGPNRFEETGQFRTKTIPGSPGIDTSKYEFDPKNPIKSTARAVGRSAESTAKSVFPVAGKMAVGAVGGVNALTGFNDALDAYSKSHSLTDRDVLMNAAKGFGGLAQITPKYMGPGSVVADAAKTAEDYNKYGINPFQNPEALRTIAHGIGTAGSAASMVPTPMSKGLGYAGMAVGMLPEAYDAYKAGKYYLNSREKSGLPKHEDVNDTPLPFNQ